MAALPLWGAALLAAGPDDRGVASSLLADLRADEAHKATLMEPLAKATDALSRGDRLRQRGDESHAKLADGLAREWAETGRDLVRAADAEARAHAARAEANDAGIQAERERARLEQAVAEGGRLRAELASVTADGGASTSSAQSVKASKRDGGGR